VTSSLHSPVALAENAARRRLLRLDWAQAFDEEIEGLKAKLIWVPFNLSQRKAALDSDDHPLLSTLSMPAQTVRKRACSGEPPARQGQALEIKNGDKILFAPFWVFGEPDRTGNWALVDACKGNICAGSLRVSAGSARSRFVLLCGLAVTTCIIGIALMTFMVDLLAFELMGGPGWLPKMVVAFVVLFLVARLWTAFEPALQEAAGRAESCRVRFPLDPNWQRIPRSLGMVFGMVAAMEAYGILSAMQAFHEANTIMVALGSILRMSGALLVVAAALAAAGPRRQKKGPAPEIVDNRWSAAARLSLHTAILASAGAALGHLLARSEVGSALWGASLGYFSWMYIGAALGSFLALHTGGLKNLARGPLTLAWLFEGLLHPFMPFLAIPIAALLLGLAEWILLRRKQAKVIGAAKPWKAALSSAWAYGIGSSSGRLLGAILGGFFFGLFGSGGPLVSRTLGGLMGAVWAYSVTSKLKSAP